MNKKQSTEEQRQQRIGFTFVNKQGSAFKVIEYIDTRHVLVEAQDKFTFQKWTTWSNIKKLNIKNPFYPDVFGVGITSNQIPLFENDRISKEYNTWYYMLRRCFDEKWKEEHPYYKDVICCEEWFYYPNFYNWLHEQKNFEKWKLLNRSALDKDIAHKGNKIYCPDRCFLVPQKINSLFTNRRNHRGNLPVGITLNTSNNITRPYEANVFMNGKNKYIGIYETPEKGFYLGYKPEKEAIIKQIAQEEFAAGNITEECYNAMMQYEVEITD